MNNITKLSLLTCAVGLLFFTTAFLAKATAPSRPANLYVKEISLLNDTIYIGEEAASIYPIFLSDYQNGKMEILAELGNFPNESKIEVYFRSSKGKEKILASNFIKDIIIKEEFFHFFQVAEDAPLQFSHITQAGLDNKVVKTPFCTSSQLKQIIASLYKKNTMGYVGTICYAPIIRSPEVDISKIYNFENKEELDNSKLILKIDNSVYREYLLGYEPGLFRPIGKRSSTTINIINILVFGVLITTVIPISIFLFLKFLKNKKEKAKKVSKK